MNEATTEQLILSAARSVFVRKGRNGARMQEIADTAGVNKMLLHYYFRNKERLFRRVVEDIAEQLIESVVRTSIQTERFHDFLEIFIDRHIDFIRHNQDMLYFLLWEARMDPAIIKDIILKKFTSLGGTPFDYVNEKIRAAITIGEIRSIEPADFVLSLVSLDIFPCLVIPLISSVADLSQEQIEELIRRRKQEAFRLLWNDLQP